MTPHQIEPGRGDHGQGGQTLLVVEDEEGVREILRKALHVAQYRVLMAETGPQARELWQKHRGEVDLLLTDVMLPDGVPGSALAGQFRAEDPALKVIIMSGFSAEMVGSDTPFSESVRFLGKPFTLQQLYSAVSDALSAHSHES